MSPDLFTNLIFVGQLVYNNCDVHFSYFGCVVQDQVLGKMIAKGHKMDQIFPLYISSSTIIPSFSLLSFARNVVGSSNKMLHRCLGHPNFNILCTLFNCRLLGNKTCSSPDLSFDCTSCKLGKSKVLLFLIMHLVPHNVLTLFIVIFGVLHPLFLMLITSILLLSLITLIVLLGFTSSGLKLKFFSIFKCFLALLETQFSASITLILAMNICLMSFITFFKANGSSLSVLILLHHSKTVLLRGKIITFFIW